MRIVMEDIDKRLTKVEDNTRKILFHLESDGSTNTKGLIESHYDMEKRLRLLELERKVEKVRSGIYGILGGAIIVVVWYVVQQWINQNIFGK